MRYLAIVLLALLAAFSSISCLHHKAITPDDWIATVKTAKTQTELDVGASKEAARAQAELDEVYHKLLSKAAADPEAAPEAVDKIKAAEIAWAAYRDAYMNAMYPAENKLAEYGALYWMEWDLLYAELTMQEVTALKELLKQYNGEMYGALGVPQR